MKVGEKFLCVDAWIIDFKGKEAKFYWRMQALVNTGFSLKDASEKAKEEMGEDV